MAISKHLWIALVFALAVPLQGCAGEKGDKDGGAAKADGDTKDGIAKRRADLVRKGRRGKGKKGPRGRKGRKGGRGKAKAEQPLSLRVCRLLTCDGAQTRVVADIIDPYVEATAKDRAGVDEHRARLGDHLRAEALDAAAVQSIRTEIEALERGMEARAWDVVARLHPTLTAEQRDIMAKRVTKRGPVFAIEGRHRIKPARGPEGAPEDAEELEDDEPEEDDEAAALVAPDGDAAG